MSAETQFINALTESLANAVFVKITLGNYKGADADLQKILIRPVTIKNSRKLSFLYRYKTRDETKNFEFAEAVQLVSGLLEKDFFAAHLFTTANDFQLEIGKKNSRLSINKPTFQTQPETAHNREKQVLINPQSPYLHALGITTNAGEIRAKQEDKWRQINKFVEILGGLFDNSDLREKAVIEIVDMGSGKGYLTFAAYDYFNNLRRIETQITGVETRENLVALCNKIAADADFASLKFVKGFISDYKIANTDVLIALHACDTATDDAIFAGINAKSDLIIAAPCCHKEIRRQISAPAMFKNVLKHGSLMEREAEIITDGLRGLLLERSGYNVKIFEFIGTEHTPKNNLIVATKHQKAVEPESLNRQIDEIKTFYNIREQRLEKLLDEEVHAKTRRMQS